MLALFAGLCALERRRRDHEVGESQGGWSHDESLQLNDIGGSDGHGTLFAVPRAGPCPGLTAEAPRPGWSLDVRQDRPTIGLTPERRPLGMPFDPGNDRDRNEPSDTECPPRAIHPRCLWRRATGSRHGDTRDPHGTSDGCECSLNAS